MENKFRNNKSEIEQGFRKLTERSFKNEKFHFVSKYSENLYATRDWNICR